MSLDIMVFEGDGIGPEIMSSTIAIIELLNAKLELNINLKKEILGFELLNQKGVTFTDDLLLKSKILSTKYKDKCDTRFCVFNYIVVWFIIIRKFTAWVIITNFCPIHFIYYMVVNHYHWTTKEKVTHYELSHLFSLPFISY